MVAERSTASAHRRRRRLPLPPTAAADATLTVLSRRRRRLPSPRHHRARPPLSDGRPCSRRQSSHPSFAPKRAESGTRLVTHPHLSAPFAMIKRISHDVDNRIDWLVIMFLTLYYTVDMSDDRLN